MEREEQRLMPSTLLVALLLLFFKLRVSLYHVMVPEVLFFSFEIKINKRAG